MSHTVANARWRGKRPALSVLIPFYRDDPCDLLRDLKRINAHLASVAYPILETKGELDESRLRPNAVLEPKPVVK